METVRRMWPKGPLRQFSDTHDVKSWTPYRSALHRGFAGSYVCDCCVGVVMGLYRVRSADKPEESPLWLCSGCREAARPRGAQPESLKRR